MLVHQSSFPYLFILCALCSVIIPGASSQDFSSQDIDNEPDALSYLDYLNENYFKGSWHSASDAQPFGTFVEHSGFFVSETKRDCVLPFTVSLAVYDSKYVDGGFRNLSLCHKFSPFFHFDSENTSFTGTNVSLKVTGKGIPDKKLIECPSDVEIYFIDRTSDGTIMEVQFIISSSECGFYITTDLLTRNKEFDYGQQIFYSIVYTILLILEIIGLFFGMALATGDVDTLISPYCIYLRLSWGFLLWLINLVFYTEGGASLIMIFPGLISFIQLIFIVIPFTGIENAEETVPRGLISIICFLITFGTVSYFSTPWAYLVPCFYLVPQIIKNYRSKEGCKLREIPFLLTFMPSQIFYIGYFWMNADDFARLRPNPLFFYTYLGVFALQVIILVFQSREKRTRYQLQVNELTPIETEDHDESKKA